ncbi:MAG: glycosyltransferase [Patescibacteria group bacterium]|nr:glycosyltransferase [Patescibacteria group bacterium]MCL5095136.1 glycosyltransferase [Patescibacteria group bacterium]
MKIGIDARLWKQTGVGRYVQELTSNLAKIDQKNHYLLFFAKNEFEEFKLPGPNFEKMIIDIRWHSLKEQIVMPYLLWREKLDLVHFPYFSVPIFYPGKFIVTIHDLILDHFETGKASTLPLFLYKLKRLGYKLVMWVALHRAVKVITVSETTKREIIKHYHLNSEKIAVTYEAA